MSIREKMNSELNLDSNPLSKSQLKKQKKREAFLERKLFKKQSQRQHVHKMRHIRDLLEHHNQNSHVTWMATDPNLKELAEKLQLTESELIDYQRYEKQQQHKRYLRKELKRSELLKEPQPCTTILIDMQFESLMTDKVGNLVHDDGICMRMSEKMRVVVGGFRLVLFS